MSNYPGRKYLAFSQVFCFSLLFGSAHLHADNGHEHASGHGQPSQLNRSVKQFTQPFQSRSIRAAENSLGQPAQFGQWSDVFSWPLIAVHANLLPNGKVLAWDATPDDFDDDPHTTENYVTRVSVWDPNTNRHTPTINDTNGDLFCAGSAQLWDGRVLFAGGDSGTNREHGPLSNTNIYDPLSNTWREAANMASPRWYASVAALANGEMLTYAGEYGPQPLAEVFQLDETWRSLSIPVTRPDFTEYQWLQSTPEGKVMSFGPQNSMVSIDTKGSGRLTQGPARDGFSIRRYGSYAMYDIGKVLVSGGTTQESGVPSYKSSVVIDSATQQTTDTGDMGFGRTQHNLTILADGSVLATGGNSDGAGLVSPVAGVYRPEIWSPETGEWRPANDMQIDRQYHSIALLLPDGRVLSAGGGYCLQCTRIGYEEQNAEIFSPPYLFSSGDTLAVRPAIASAPSTVDYDSTFDVSVSSASDISKVHLIKLGSVTHSQNQDQRLVPLSFSGNRGLLAVNSPASRNIAPPGHYMLVVLDQSGVPSVSRIVRVGQPLLESGMFVSNSIRPNEVDEYVIQSTWADKTLIVNVSDQSSQLRLSVRGVADNNSDTALCNKQSTGSFECRLSNVAPTRWKIKLASSVQTPYSLVANFSEDSDPNAEQPQANSDQLDDNINSANQGNGGGGMGFYFVLGFVALFVTRESLWRKTRVM